MSAKGKFVLWCGGARGVEVTSNRRRAKPLDVEVKQARLDTYTNHRGR